MKKALAILLAFALVGAFAFAQDAVTYGNEAAVAVTGNATLTWGYNLNNKVNGFDNSAEWKIIIPLLAKQSFGTKSEGDNFAEINIVDAQYIIEGNHDGDDAKAFKNGDKGIDSVNAKLNFGPVYMTVHGAPSFKVNNAEIWETIKADGYFDDPNEGFKNRFEPGFDGFGTKIGYKTDMFDVGVKVASKDTYKDRTTAKKDAKTVTVFATKADIEAGLIYELDGTPVATTAVTREGDFLLKKTPAVPESTNKKSEYAFGVDVSATPIEMLDVSASFNYATWARKDQKAVEAGKDPVKGIMSLGFKAVAKPMEGFEVKLAMDAGNDATTVNKDGKTVDVFAWDALASAKYQFVEAGVYVAAPGTEMSGTDKKGLEIMDMAAFVKLTDGKFVENLDAWFTFMTYNLLSESDPKMPTPMAIGTGAKYKISMNDVNYVQPFFELYAQNCFDTTSKKEAEKLYHVANVGVNYGLFTNTVVTAKYETGSTKDNSMANLIDTPSKSDKGLFTLACKVTY